MLGVPGVQVVQVGAVDVHAMQMSLVMQRMHVVQVMGVPVRVKARKGDCE